MLIRMILAWGGLSVKIQWIVFQKNKPSNGFNGRLKRPSGVCRGLTIQVLACLTVVFILVLSVNSHRKIGEKEDVVEQAPAVEEDVHEYVAQEDADIQALVPGEEVFIPDFESVTRLKTLEQLGEYVYSIDPSAYMMEEDVDVEAFIQRDFRMDLKTGEPKILIFHTHSQEEFIDSRPGVEEDTIVGVGRRLAEILVNQYGISVVHDVGKYDYKNGEVVREGSYQVMEPGVQKILEKYPSIEILIDMHRDGVPESTRLVMNIDGRPTAKIMFFNGITRENRGGSPKELPQMENPYLRDNLALSLQLFLASNELYPGLARRIYIRPYRYSLHMKPLSMLVEVGANTNTLEEAQNAMIPLADILVTVLQN